MPLKSPPAEPVGDPPPPPPAFASTNAVEAACVVFVPTAAVGTVGVPVSAGETDSTAVVPEPVVVAAIICPLLFVAATGADADTDAPLTPVALAAVPVVFAALFGMIDA